MTEKPQTAADPRPNSEPYYIDSHCDCETKLVYYHVLRAGDVKGTEMSYPTITEIQEPFFDEFVCPDCLDGVHLDWPEEKVKSVLMAEYDDNEFGDCHGSDVTDKSSVAGGEDGEFEELLTTDDVKEKLTEW